VVQLSQSSVIPLIQGKDLAAEMERRDKEDEEEKRDLRLLQSPSTQLKELRENQERIDQAYKK